MASSSLQISRQLCGKVQNVVIRNGIILRRISAVSLGSVVLLESRKSHSSLTCVDKLSNRNRKLISQVIEAIAPLTTSLPLFEVLRDLYH
jgi:hypothetical protein